MRMKNEWKLTGMIIRMMIFILISLQSRSQTGSDSISVSYPDSTEKTLQTIVLSTTRYAQIISASLVPVTYISRTNIIRSQSRSTPEMLTGTPGVWMQKTNQGGGSPFLRGLTGNQVLTMIDGIRLNNATYRYGPNQYLSTIDPWSLGSAETLRSTGSVLYGSDAIGGVVYLQTEKPGYSDSDFRLHGSVMGRAMGKGMEWTSGAKVELADKNWAGIISANISNFGDIVSADNHKQTPTGYKQQAANGRLNIRIAKNQELTAAFQWLRQQDVDLYDQVTQKDYAQYKIDPLERKLLYLRWAADYKSKFLSKIQLTIFNQLSDETRIRQRNNSFLVTTERDQVKTGGFSLDVISRFSQNYYAGTGIDFYADRVTSNATEKNTQNDEITYKRGLYPDGSKMNSLAIFHRHQWQIGKWQTEAGIRASFYTVEMKDPQFGNVSLTPNALVWNLGASYDIGSNWKITGNLSTAFRSPNINDMGSFGKFDFGIEVPAVTLEPEKAFNKEIGIKKTLDKFLFSFSAYHNKLTNLIDRVPSTFNNDSVFNGEKVYTKENTGLATIYGFETEFSVRAINHVQIYSHFTYTYGQNISADEPMRRIPPFFGKTGIQHTPFKNFYYSAEWQYAGSQKRLAAGDKADHRINSNGTPGWGIVQIRFGYTWKFVSFQSGIENIFDQSYRMHGSGIDGYGRTGWIRMAFSF